MRLEVGAVYAVVCLGCRRQLIVGWDGDIQSTPEVGPDAIADARLAAKLESIAGASTVVRGTPDANQVIAGPLVCTCPNACTAFYDATRARCVVDWSDPALPPLVSNLNHHVKVS